MFDNSFVLTWQSPRGPLRAFVGSIWVHRGDPTSVARELVMPNGDVDLVIDLERERLVAAGPATRSFVLDAAGRRETVGAVLRVGAAAPVLGVPLVELQDRRVSLFDVWGASATELLERTLAARSAGAKLEAFQRVMAARLGRVGRHPHPVAARAAQQLARFPEHYRIAQLSDDLGVSARRLEQVFRAEIGLPPKAYQRLHRFRRALAQIDRAAEIGWAAYALERGYYDQSHFVGDFRAHAGLTPSQYVAARGPELNHVPVAT